ncbi:hypothetical protein NKR23_g10410 [Pleurostoma richardsiae]|uniref:DUF7707 domain-containing protein n=1 Tax=Pleurostoma richardsiae TaxID=41990 RepID=A0AA38R584_9PEZI|nr:hypothetical protein NKR23_g10410 [Pleurostoma richardsiae]
MRFHIAAVALSALTLVAAQNFTIDPNEVTLSTRASWCQGETSVCNTLCDSEPTANSCDPNTLDYSCTCQNGSAPGLEYYLQSLPTFICQQAFADCISANTGSAQGQSNCTTTIGDKCGTLDASNYTAPAASSSAAASSTSSAAATSTAAASATAASGTAAASSSSTAAAAPTNVQHIGNGAAAVAIGLFAYLL